MEKDLCNSFEDFKKDLLQVRPAWEELVGNTWPICHLIILVSATQISKAKGLNSSQHRQIQQVWCVIQCL